MDHATRSEAQAQAEPAAGERYLLLVDITGYTGFMTGVEVEHGIDFGAGIPAAYGILGALLDGVVEGIAPDFALVKLEGDAVFAAAATVGLDGQGDRVLAKLGDMYREFIVRRTAAIPANDHVCTACPAVAHLDLKMVLHRGPTVRQSVGSGTELLGPSVNIAHRLLKNTVRERIGSRPYPFISDAAAGALGVPDLGLEHREAYPDAGRIQGRIIELGDPVPGDVSA